MKNTQEIDIQLTEEDKDVIKAYAEKIEVPNCYLEIGTAEGGSAYMALQVVKPGVKIYTVDIKDLFKLKNTKINFIHKSSLEAVKSWNKPIGVLFIDGDHDMAGEDFNAWEKFVIPGGVILFHDYAHHSPKVIKDCEETLKNKNYKLLYRPSIGQVMTSIFRIIKVRNPK